MSISSSTPLTPAAPAAPARESIARAVGRAVWEALASLARAPRYSAPAVLSLALGLGAATAVFAVFSALVLRPLPFPEEERLVRVGFKGASPVRSPDELLLSAPFLRDFRKLDSIFEQVGTDHTFGARLDLGGRALRVTPLLASLNFFDTLGIQALEGRLFSARGSAPDGLDVIVVREGYWREELGAQPILGKTVLFDGRPVTVIGVVRDDQAIPSYGQIWIPEDQSTQVNRMGFMGRGIARLAPGVSLETARARLLEATRDAGVFAPKGGPLSAQLIPLRESLVQPQRAWVGLMLAAVMAFLLLAAANLAALFATRSTARAHEWAVRRALGSRAIALARRSALEAALVGIIGASLGLLLARFAIRFANRAYLEDLGNTPARLDARVLIACGLATLLCALAGALAPVLSMRRVQPADALRGEGRSTDTPRARRLRELLLVVQVAVTTVLLINAGLIVRSVRSLLAVNTGFESGGVVTAGVLLPIEQMPPNAAPETWDAVWKRRTDTLLAQARAVLARLQQMPGAEHATVTIDMPFDWHSFFTPLALPPDAAQKELIAYRHVVGPGYFETFGIPLISGSDFASALVPEDRGVAVVSRSFARALGLRDAVGQRFRFAYAPADAEPFWVEVIGMVEDTLENDLGAPPPIQVYFPFAWNPLAVSGPTSAAFHFVVRGNDGDALARELPRVISEALPETTTPELRTMEEWVAHAFWQQTALSRVLSALGIAAVILSAIGLYGITSFAVAQRTGEVGIRRALGASRGAVVRLVLRETARVVFLGVAVGAGLSWFARQLLGSFLFGVGALDALTYGGVCLGVVLVALLSALAPARSAARVSPARALTGL
jgi:putative ABC transport system permease protein